MAIFFSLSVASSIAPAPIAILPVPSFADLRAVVPTAILTQPLFKDLSDSPPIPIFRPDEDEDVSLPKE